MPPPLSIISVVSIAQFLRVPTNLYVSRWEGRALLMCCIDRNLEESKGKIKVNFLIKKLFCLGVY